MKNVLVLGLGGSGTNVINFFLNNNYQADKTSFLAIDSDIEALAKINGIPKICLTEYVLLGNVIEKLDKKTVSDWFPCDDADDKVSFFKTLEMGKGANGWRMKGLLSFEYMLSDSEKRGEFTAALDKLIDKKNENNEIEIIIVSSLIGGTGSALFLAVAAFVKRYFRLHYNKEIIVKTLLSCPEIYTDSLTAENRVKAFANAYAAAAELNAVDLVSKGYNAKAEAESRCKISFKIGSEKSKGIGVLFDSESEEFAVPSAQPFKRVYFFDRIPGTETISAHENIMAQVLSLIIKDEPEENCSDIYAGISIAEIVYPYKSILDYVAKKKVFDDIEGEWLSLYNVSETISDRYFGEDEIFNFARSFTEAYKDLYATSYYSQHLALHREKEEGSFIPNGNYAEPVISAEYIQNYIKRLIDGCSVLFEDKTAKSITETLDDKDEEIRALSLFDNKAKKAQKLAAVKEKAEFYNKLILERYKAGSRICKEAKDKIKVAVNNAKNPDSLFNKIITYQGKYLHPITALLLLCEVYSGLKAIVLKTDKNFTMLYDSSDIKEMPDGIIRVAKLSQNVNEEYAKLGVVRFKTIAKKDIGDLSFKIINAFSDIKKDFNDINNYMTEQFTGLCLEHVLFVIGDVIKRYVDILKITPEIIANHKIDVKLALIAETSDSCTKMNVGCSEDIKEKAYRLYVASVQNDCSRDEYTGRIFYDYALNKANKDDIFKNLVSEERTKVEQTPVMKRVTDLDVFRILHDRDIFNEQISEKTCYNDFKRAFSLVALPLDIALKEDITKSKTKIKTVTIVPIEAAIFAQQGLKDSSLSLQEAVDKYLFRQGNCEVPITVSKTMPKNRIFAMQKIYDFELSLFNKLNESIDRSYYYKNYIKALGVKKEQSTQMWNPRLVKEKPSDFLPFIDPLKRENYEKNIYKAALYMLFSGRFFVGQNESGHDVFFYIDGDKKEQVRYKNKDVLYKNPELLFGYIRENTEFAETFGMAWDKEIEKEISDLPTIGFEKTDVTKLKNAILKSVLVRFLASNFMSKIRSEKALKAKNIFDMIFETSEDETEKAEAINIGRTVYDLLQTMVNSRPLSEETRELLFKDIMKQLKEDYEQKSKRFGDKTNRKKSDMVFTFICKKQ